MEFFKPVLDATGPLDAITCCFPPGATGGSDLPLFYKILNLIGIVKARRAEGSIFLGLQQGHLVYCALDYDGDVIANARIPLPSITAARVTPRDEYSHNVSFSVDGKEHSYVTCAYFFGAPGGTPPELVPKIKAMEASVVRAIAARA